MHRPSRPLLTATLALGLAGCGLSDYEALMREAQAREQRFRDENTSLAAPVNIPTKKVKDKDVRLAEVFFRPPRGIGARAQAAPRNDLLYHYDPQANSDVLAVELAFASDSKDFGRDVTACFHSNEAAQWQTRQLQPPERPPLAFNTLEISDAERSYSINLYQKGQTQVAVVFWVRSPITAQVRKVMDLSLESLAVGDESYPAQQRYGRKASWQLGRDARP